MFFKLGHRSQPGCYQQQFIKTGSEKRKINETIINNKTPFELRAKIKNNYMNAQQHDEELWRIAKRRAAFKRSLAIYFFVNLLFVITWYLSSGIGSYFWPIWPMFGWGIGIAFQYTTAYHNNNMFSAQSEYDRLKNQQNNSL